MLHIHPVWPATDWGPPLVELKLPFGLMPALGIKCAIFRLNSLKALNRLRDGSSNGEIICLAFDYKPVSPGWKYKVFTFGSDHYHLRAFAKRRDSEIVRYIADGPCVLHVRRAGRARGIECHRAQDFRDHTNRDPFR